MIFILNIINIFIIIKYLKNIISLNNNLMFIIIYIWQSEYFEIKYSLWLITYYIKQKNIFIFFHYLI